jgi:hypothetical protein
LVLTYRKESKDRGVLCDDRILISDNLC